MKTSNEADVILHYRPRVLQLCKSRWNYMRFDEKIAEADYFMLSAIRTPAIGTRNFWDTFVFGFVQYMDKLYHNECRRRFACISLDARHATSNQESSWTLLERLPQPSSFESSFVAKEFLASLPKQMRFVLLDLIAKVPKAQIMRKYGLTRSKLKEVQRKLRNAYCAWTKPPLSPSSSDGV